MKDRAQRLAKENAASGEERLVGNTRGTADNCDPGRERGTVPGRATTGNLQGVHKRPTFRRQGGVPFSIIRRRLTAELLDLTCLGAEFLASGGRSALRPKFITGNTVLDLAIRRLAKSGLVTYRRTRGKTPLLIVTDHGRSHGSELLWPERSWNRSWDGRWHLLSYDVPEKERGYRCALERFFRRERMGCLQKSVWISARDIRPLFDDLDLAASIRDYAILFEVSPVLGQSPRQIASQAWDFKELARRHKAYLNHEGSHTNQTTASPTPSAALAAARRELFEYLAVMQADPLLPAELLPDDYAGRRVAAEFRSRLGQLLGQMFSL